MGTDGEERSNDRVRWGDLVSLAQCSRRVWLERHRPERKSDDPVYVRVLRDAAVGVREVAAGHSLLKGCVPVKRDTLEASISATREAMEHPEIPGLLQPTLESDGVVGEPDALVRGEDGGWWIVAIRSSLRVKQVHVPSLAMDAHALRICGYSLAGASLVHLNPDYRRGTELDLEALFVVADVTHLIPATDEGASLVRHVRNLRALPTEPDVSTGRHCQTPLCPFFGHCEEPIGKYDIRRIPGGARLSEKAGKDGIKDFRNLPATTRLSPLQRRAIRCIETGDEWVSEDLYKALAEDVVYPLHFLDFGAIQPPIPIQEGVGPFQTYPMQWTACVLSANGAIRTMDYVNTQGYGGSLERWAQTLRRTLQSRGTVFVYSRFEMSLLKKISEVEDGWLESVIPRFVDLLAILRRHYYHADFQGSYARSRVNPVLAPELVSEQIEAKDDERVNAYLRYHNEDLTPVQRIHLLRGIRTTGHMSVMELARIYQYLLNRALSTRRFVLSPNTQHVISKPTALELLQITAGKPDMS